MDTYLVINIFKNAFWFVLDFWWVIAPIFLGEIFWNLWLSYIRLEYAKAIDWVILEVQLPPEVERTPKAMEQIFAVLHATLSKGNLIDRYWKGKIQDWFSFEVISRSGKIEFLIHLPARLKNFFESKIYAQYPHAEIKEIDDYASFVPNDLPNENYNLWGAELIFAKEDAYPIKTYLHFEETIEERRLDPMSQLLEVLAKLGEEENIFIQLLVRPTNDEWKKKGEELVAKLLGKKKPKELEWYEEVAYWIKNYFRLMFLGKAPEWGQAPKSEGPETRIQHMSPGEKAVLEAIEEKLSKFGFEAGIRFLYLAPVEKFSMANVSGIFGGFKQVGSLNLNSFKPNADIMTSINYFFKKTREYYRKKILLKAFKLRLFTAKQIILNTAELATLYHYPGLVVGAPMLPRIQAKKGEPPATLPVGE